ncbi:hypothetical protein V3390_09275 [Luteimonas sp. FXH3W]|uniref:Uncharacterized protein n=1 Tax=Aquilutibacter rugosus TaxID=3115820 RepID=A0ABU7V242_9GAMM
MSNTKKVARWTVEENAYLRDQYAAAAWPEMVRALGRNEGAIRNQALSLGLNRQCGFGGGHQSNRSAQMEAKIDAAFPDSLPTAVELSEEFDIGLSTAARYIRRLRAARSCDAVEVAQTAKPSEKAEAMRSLNMLVAKEWNPVSHFNIQSPRGIHVTKAI